MPKKGTIELLVVEDDPDFRETCERWMQRMGHNVKAAENGHVALELFDRHQFDVVLLDMNMPGLNGLEVLDRIRDANTDAQVVILTGQGSIENAVAAMQLGASDYLTKPFPLDELERRCMIARERGQVSKENRQLREIIKRSKPKTKIVGESPKMNDVFRLIDRVAPTSKPVLIQGESGTGKELVARMLQEKSDRSQNPFVTINCAALPEQLVESELFGHQKGAFTGATADKPGLFEVADGGTLFIDEIGELPPGLQPKLLRVLEDGSFRRVGSHREKKVDVRIVAATNRDLKAEVAANRFREDLYYRINVMSLELPPLRERAGDVRLLIEFMLPDGWTIEEDAQQKLQAYQWPGNVRQLGNVIERASILADDRLVTIDDLPSEIAHAASFSEPTDGSDHTSTEAAMPQSQFEPGSHRLDELERAHIIDILNQQQGNKAAAARVLGIHRRKLYRLIERYKIGDETA
jgi:DNA-binding NtrC family response regulator